MIMSVPGGCVVVTGAASGIGKAISIEVSKKGFLTVLWDVDQAQLLRKMFSPYTRSTFRLG